jgi:hypothetical protein
MVPRGHENRNGIEMKRAFSLALMAGILATSSASAQSILPFSAEIRGGLGIKNGEFRESDPDITTASGGVGFGANVAFDFIPGVAVYGGYDRYSFNATVLGVDAEYVDQGFVAGARIAPPIKALLGFQPWVRGGVLFHDLELTDVNEKSDRSTGFEVGGGIEIPLGLVLSFTPGVVFRSYSPSFGGGDIGTADGSVQYFDVSMGLKARI